MVSTRFFLTILPFGHALAQDWNNWQQGPDVYTTTTVTNTKYVCPCDSTSTSWGTWAPSSSMTQSYQSWATASTKPYQSWSSVNSEYPTTWMNIPMSSSASSTWFMWQTSSTSSSSSSSATWANWQSGSSTSTSSMMDPATTTSSSSTSSMMTTSTTSSSSTTSMTMTTTSSSSTTTSSTTSSTTTTTPAAQATTLFILQAFNNPTTPDYANGALVLSGNANEQYLHFVEGANAAPLGLDADGYLIDPLTGEFANVAPGTSDQIYFNDFNTIAQYTYARMQCEIAQLLLVCSAGNKNTFSLDAQGNAYLSAQDNLPAANQAVNLRVLTVLK